MAISGLPGIGKTSLTIKLAQQIEGEFEYVIWRSLRARPSLDKILTDWLKYLSPQPDSSTITEKTNQLVEQLRSLRCLLILDDLESIFASGTYTGKYKEGYENYGYLLTRLGETAHQSCLVLTSLEIPQEVTLIEGQQYSVRSLNLMGLDVKAERKVIQEKGSFWGTDEDWKQLVKDYYGGHPLALKIVAKKILDLSNGNIIKFNEEILHKGNVFFEEINKLLDEPFDKLSENEREIMYWLAINRDPVFLNELQEDIISLETQEELPGALASLKNRSMIETTEQGYILHNIVREYIIERLQREIYDALKTKEFKIFNRHALTKVTSKDYIKETQIQRLLKPVAEKFLTLIGNINLKEWTKKILDELRHQNPGYGVGNLINLLSYLNVDLSGCDFSKLTIRQADLRTTNLKNADFSQATITKSSLITILDRVLAVVFSPNGDVLATGDADGNICLWRVADGQQSSRYREHPDWVWSVAFSPDGKMLASGTGGNARKVRLWDISAGECIELKTLGEHSQRVRSVAFSPDSQILASGSDDQTIKLWNVSTGKRLNSLKAKDQVKSVVFSPDGEILASGSQDGTIEFWNVTTGEHKTIAAHQAQVRSLVFSKDGETLISGSADKTIKFWDINTGICKETLDEHKNWVESIALSPDGQTLISRGDDYTIKMWNVKTGQCNQTLEGHKNWVGTVAISPDGQTFASGSHDQTVRIWDTKTRQCHRVIKGYSDPVHTVSFSSKSFSSNRQILASGGSSLRLWDIAKNDRLQWEQNQENWLWSVDFSPDEKLLASAGDDDKIRLWDVESGQCLKIFPVPTFGIRSIAFSPDGKTLAAGGDDHKVRLWEVDSGTELAQLEGHQNRVRAVAFSSDGKLLASGSADKTIKLWDANSWKDPKTLSGHTNQVHAIAFSPDGKLLASGSADGTVILWDTEKSENKTLEVENWIWSVAFSPDGQMLAIGTDDKTIQLWDISSEKCFKTDTLEGHTRWIWSVVFSPDGKWLASGSQDGTIRLWDVKTRESQKPLRAPRPYEGMNIQGVQGLTKVQIMTLIDLGALEETPPSLKTSEATTSCGSGGGI